MVKVMKGLLIEYSFTIPPLAIAFDLNPESLTRTRTMSVGAGNSPADRGGYDFTSPLDAGRAAQGVTMAAETMSVIVMLDATDRMNEGEPIATLTGVQPEIDTLRSMIEPKTSGAAGLKTLASLAGGEPSALANREYASVILFRWGVRILPVFLTSVSIEEIAHLPNLFPYRARATLSMQVIESDNPFYSAEVLRQLISSAANTARLGAEAVAGIF